MPTMTDAPTRKGEQRRAARLPVMPGRTTGKNLSINADGSASIKLDALTVGVLVKEAKTCRKPASELAALLLREALEDARDLRDARRVLARVKSGKEATVPWSQVKAELGL